MCPYVYYCFNYHIVCTHNGGVTSYSSLLPICYPYSSPPFWVPVFIFIQVPPFSLGVTLHPESGDLTCPRRAHARRRIVRVSIEREREIEREMGEEMGSERERQRERERESRVVRGYSVALWWKSTQLG